MQKKPAHRKSALRDYLTVIETFPVPPTRSICEYLHGKIGSTESFQKCFDVLQEQTGGLVSCITDEYAKLRYTLFFLDRCFPEVRFGRAPLRKNGIGSYHLLRTFFSHNEAEVRKAVGTREKSRDLIEKAAFLKAASTRGTFLSTSNVLPMLGESRFLDSCAVEVVRNSHGDWDKDFFLKSMHDLFFSGGTAKETRALLADLSSEMGLDLFTEEEFSSIVRKNIQDRKLGPALCRYAGERKAYGVLPVLHEELFEAKRLPLSVMCAVFDTLGQIGNEDSLEVLDRFVKERATKRERELPGVVADIAEKAEEEILRRIAPQEPSFEPGKVLVQCAFYGDVTRPGQAGGGGLATLLDTLGASLARTGNWERVYTFLLFHLNEGSADTRLVESSGNARHLLVRVPVDFPAHNQACHFLAHEYEIMRAVRRAVEMHGISPDVFHVRYSDNASRAVMRLARLLGKILVFTLTPDPHRNLSGREGMIRRMDTEDVLMNVNKVEIADELVEHANGIVLIGHGNRNDQIIPYFPALWLDEKVRERPVRIIAEGIDMNMNDLGKAEEKTYRSLLRNHGGRFALNDEASRGPLILNVGRLNPLKGQHILVEAWASSEISAVFSLVLVGGNLPNPDSTERSMLDRVEKIVQASARLKGRFCHIGAIPNRDVRMLERGIAKTRETGLPPVYVCSSLKEEFGISILEAMSEGFLIFAPERGGVSSYLKHGENGFLIDTHSVASMKEGLEKILLSKNFSHQKLFRIAEKGKTFAKETFSIDRMAAELTDFYRDLEKGGQG